MMLRVLFPIALLMATSVAHANLVIDIADPKQLDWTQVTLRDDGPASGSATTRNGAGNELDVWRVTYVAPASTGPFAASNVLAAIYEPFAWDLGTDGGIERIDVSFDLLRTFSGFASGVSGFVRPVVRQAGNIYSVAFSSVAVDASFRPAQAATWSLLNTDNWVTSSGGTGLDFSANGDDIYFGFRWDLGSSCAGVNGCSGVSAVTTLDNLRFDISPVVSAVPEPGVLSMFLSGLGLLGFTTRRRQTGSA